MAIFICGFLKSLEKSPPVINITINLLFTINHKNSLLY